MKDFIKFNTSDEGGAEPTAWENPIKDEATLNKTLQSERSKAKGELLKEIGFTNVEQIKEAIAKGSTYESTAKDLTNAQELLAQSNSKVEELSKRIKEFEDNDLLTKLGIPKEKGELFIKLVDEDNSELTREEKATKVKKDLVGIVGSPMKVGSEKTPNKEVGIDPTVSSKYPWLK